MPDTASINVTIPRELKDSLDAAAEMQDRNASTVVKRALDHYLNCVDSAENPCQHRYDERGAGVVGVIGAVDPAQPGVGGTPGAMETK